MRKSLLNFSKHLLRDSISILYYNLYKRFLNIQGNRSLIYHAFGLKLKHDTYGISIDINNFKEHMKYVHNNHKVIALKNYAKYDVDSVSITIDDGYKDTISAVDILNTYNVPFNLFITTNNIDTKNYLSSQDIRDISTLDIANIGSHGCSHRKLAELNPDEQSFEINQSKKILQDIIGGKIFSYSYPHGSYDDTTLNIIKLSGYDYAASSIKGKNDKYVSQYVLCRNEIISSDKISDISKKIKGYYDYY